MGIFATPNRQTVREALRRRAEPPSGSRRARLLSGLLVCSGCGRGLYSGRGGGDVKVYRCTSHGDAKTCPRPVTVAAESLEAAVETLWLSDWGKQPETEIIYSPAGGEALALLEEEIAGAEAEVLRRRGAERLDALRRLEALEADRDALSERPTPRVGVLRETGRTYADAWRAGTMEDRREALAATVGTLTITPGRRGGRGFDLAGRVADLSRFDTTSE